MKITLLNQNIWLLPPPLSIENLKRLDNFARLIRQLKPDIVTLQEVWLSRYVARLKSLLPEYHVISTDSGFFNKTGLLILSKFLPTSKEAFAFPMSGRHNPFEWIGKKGYLRIQIGQSDRKISVFNTHLYCAMSDTVGKITLEQFRYLKHLTQKNDSTATVVSGDLNLPPGDFNAINEGFYVSDRITGFTKSKYNAYCNRGLNKLYGTAEVDEKIDYVLAAPSNGISMKCNLITEPVVSDHFAIYAEIDIGV